MHTHEVKYDPADVLGRNNYLLVFLQPPMMRYSSGPSGVLLYYPQLPPLSLIEPPPLPFPYIHPRRDPPPHTHTVCTHWSHVQRFAKVLV